MSAFSFPPRTALIGRSARHRKAHCFMVERSGQEVAAEPPELMWQIASCRWYELLIEYNQLQNANQCPDGVYVIPVPDRLGVFQIIMYVQAGVYHGGPIKLELVYGDNYPEELPLVFLVSRIPHPRADSEDALHYEDFRMDNSKAMSTVLETVQRLFTDKFIKNLPRSQYIDPSLKSQYRQHHLDPIFSAMCVQD